MNCIPKLGRLKQELRRKGLAPELLRGQSLRFNLPSPRVPMGDVRVQVRLEGLEVGPCPSPEELVLHVAEDLPGGAVVDAVALSGHALDDPGVLRPPAPCGVLVLPAHVAVEHRFRALGIFASSWSSSSACCAMPGPVDVDHATISLLPKLYAGAK